MKSRIFVILWAIVECLVFIALVVTAIYQIQYMAKTNQMILCYNAGANGYGNIVFPYKCSLVPRGHGY